MVGSNSYYEFRKVARLAFANHLVSEVEQLLRVAFTQFTTSRGAKHCRRPAFWFTSCKSQLKEMVQVDQLNWLNLKTSNSSSADARCPSYFCISNFRLILRSSWEKFAETTGKSWIKCAMRLSLQEISQGLESNPVFYKVALLKFIKVLVDQVKCFEQKFLYGN